MKSLVAVFLFILPITAFCQDAHILRCELAGDYMDKNEKNKPETFEWVIEKSNSAIAQEFKQDMRIMFFATLLEDAKLMLQVSLLDPKEFKAPVVDFMNIYKLSYDGKDEIFLQTEFNEINYSLTMQCSVKTPWTGL